MNHKSVIHQEKAVPGNQKVLISKDGMSPHALHLVKQTIYSQIIVLRGTKRSWVSLLNLNWLAMGL